MAELTPEAVLRFSEVGIDEVFPYSLLLPTVCAGGIGLWGRYPLTALPAENHGSTIAGARRAVRPAGRRRARLLPGGLRREFVRPVANGIDALQADVHDFADTAGAGAVIVAGDFNSTPDMRQFRDLLTNGYRDAVGQTGAGFAPTFPSNEWFPPVITIDHALTRNAAATSIDTVTLPGSDHRSPLTTIRVPLDLTAS